MFSGADVGSDHDLAVSTIRLSLAALKQHKQQLRYNTSNLLNKDILTSFNATISGRFQALPELPESSDINEEWTNFTSTVNKATTEHLGHRRLYHRRGKRGEWISSNSRDPIAKRKATKPNFGSEYRKLNRQTKASLRNDKTAWHSKIASELESAASTNNMREVYQKQKILLEKTSKRTSQIRDKNAVILKDEGAQLERWAEYFNGLLNADETVETIDVLAYVVPEELNTNMEPPSREEPDKANGLLKRNKAPGIDNITSQILKDGGEAIREWLLCICQQIWQTELTPADHSLVNR